MVKRTYLIILTALVTAAVILTSGCDKDKRVMISSIMEKPDKYMRKDVIVAGRVVKAYRVNLVLTEAGAYQLDDGSGKIWVITKTDVPPEGIEVGLKGKVSGGAKILGVTFGAVIHEEERRTR